MFFIDKESDDIDLEYKMQGSISYFKCDVYEFECQGEVTLNKHKNTKHHPKSRLGPGTCGYLLFVRKQKHEEAEIIRKSWKENASELVSQGTRIYVLSPMYLYVHKIKNHEEKQLEAKELPDVHNMWKEVK